MHQALSRLLKTGKTAFDESLKSAAADLAVEDVGRVASVGYGVVQVKGLKSVRYEEVLNFSNGLSGMALDVFPNSVGAVLLGQGEGLFAGSPVRRTGQVVSVPVGQNLLGRVVDPLARPLDNRGPVRGERSLPIERSAPAIMDRLPVTVPLNTGLKVVDALIPIGRGQRELIVGDRQSGKTAVATDTIINQKNFGVLCIYCAIGKRASEMAKLKAALQKAGAMDYTVMVVTTEQDPPGLQYIAPYAATSMGEHFMEQGRDVLIVYDDLTRHARAYREMSLLLERPPGREAFPGDIFYIHSRLLERSTHLSKELGGGSLTALPVVETEAQNISAYIPTNLISITDGQIYLSPDLFSKGILPAVDVGKSVSRVGGKTQLPAYRSVAGDLRLSYSQFTELESFARFGTRLDEDTRQKLERGRRVRAVLQQNQASPLTAGEQIVALVCVTKGVFDSVEPEKIASAEARAVRAVMEKMPGFEEEVGRGGKTDEARIEQIRQTARDALGQVED
jgi:F-type H+-transporting ATPase subunit alpha